MVAQNNLGLLAGMREQMERMRENIRQMGALVFEQLERGEPVEEGAHTAEIRELRDPTQLSRVLFVDGRVMEAGS